MNLLSIPMQENDADVSTVGEYLSKLLSTLWREDEDFSGKRPFGNSGWKWDVYTALVRASVVPGRLDEDGWPEDVDEDAADALVQVAIRQMGGGN